MRLFLLYLITINQTFTDYTRQNDLINKQKQDELAKLYNATQMNNLSTLGRKDGKS